MSYITEFRLGGRAVKVQSTCIQAARIRAATWLQCDVQDMEEYELRLTDDYTGDVIRLAVS